MPTKKTKAERTYRRVLAEHERSGLSIRAFAAERGHSPGHLSWWRHEIRKRDAARETLRQERPKPAKRTKLTAPSAPAFLPVRVIEDEVRVPVADSAAAAAPALEEGGYEVVVANGRRVLRLPRDFDVARVEALVRAVEAAC